jgi:hypothetical protein
MSLGVEAHWRNALSVVARSTTLASVVLALKNSRRRLYISCWTEHKIEVLGRRFGETKATIRDRRYNRSAANELLFPTVAVAIARQRVLRRKFDVFRRFLFRSRE